MLLAVSSAAATPFSRLSRVILALLICKPLALIFIHVAISF
jgi:hypothetical protein